MIQLSKELLNEVEYLLDQSSQGNHVLFESSAIRRVFRPTGQDTDRAALSESEAYSVEHHIERLISQPSISRKRAYLDSLDLRTFETVVRTYLNIVENAIYDRESPRH